MRIRSIKPEFWRSEDVARLSIEDRLLFVGLWSYVDDNGVGLDRLAEVAADLFAFDLERDAHETFARVSRGLAKLSEAGLIARYTVAERAYLAVTGWSKHQRIDHANKARYPGPDQGIPTPPARSSRDPRETLAPGTGEQGNRGTEEQGITTLSEQSSNERATGTEITVREPTGPAVVEPEIPPQQSRRSSYPAAFEAFWDAYPRHEGKRKAATAWRAACRRASEEEIADGARRYRDDPNREEAYTAHPTTWLNRDGWQDAPLPRRRPESQQDRLEASTRETLATLHRMGVA